MTTSELFTKIIVVAIIMFGCVILSRGINTRLKKHRARIDSTDENIQESASIVGDTIFFGCLGIGVIASTYILGFNTGLIMGGMVFAIAYASKSFIGSLLSGIMILATKEFQMGDIIELKQGKKSYFGKIENITLKYTVIRRLTRKRVVIPNYMMTEFPITTYTSEDLVRLETAVMLPYAVDIDRCKAVIQEAINTLDFVREKEASLIFIDSLGPDTITMKLFFYIDPKAGRLRFRAVSDVNHAIFAKFKEHAIPFCYPHQQLTVDKPTKNDASMYQTMAALRRY